MIIDADKQDEVIHFNDYGRITFSGKHVYAKYRQLTVDFKGNQITNEEDYIRIKSLWYTELPTGNIRELVPYGEYDIKNVRSSEHYVYFIKILDKDGDGLLGDNDYQFGKEPDASYHKALGF